MADAPPRLRAQQLALTWHLRDPLAREAPEGWEDRRLAVYRELVFNNLEGLLAANFPVLRAVLGDAEWPALVRAFQRDHACETPLFPELGREMIAWLESLESLPRPFIRELAHYEWVELALQVSDVGDVAFDPIDAGIDAVRALLDGVPLVSPLAWPLAYAWPVHRIDVSHQPSAPPAGPTLLLVRRDAQGAVRFSELAPLAYRLLERIAEAPGLTGRQQLSELARETQHDDVDAFVMAATPLLRQLHDTRVILGVAST